MKRRVKMTESECEREKERGGERWKGERPTSILQHLSPLKNALVELHGQKWIYNS